MCGREKNEKEVEREHYASFDDFYAQDHFSK